MKRFRNITSIVTILLLGSSLLASSTLLAVGLLGSTAPSKPASILLQEGLYAEEIEGDLDAAIKIYEQVITQAKAAEQTAAQATYRLGVCYLKKGEKQKAAEQFQNLVSKFPQHESLVAKAQEHLAKLKPLVSTTAGFGPVIERIVNDDGVGKDFMLDLDTGSLFSVSDAQDKSASLEDFILEQGIDVIGETKSSVRGLMGVDMVVIPIANERWDISPEDVVEGVSLGSPGRPVVMSGKGELPATYMFKTQKGGVGVLQILEVEAGKAPRHVRIRYKMVQEKAKPMVKVTRRKVFLPDADTPGVNVILDLASGELLPAGEGVHQLTVFREMGKGDLAYDRAFICLRGGKAKLLQAGKLTNLKIKGQIEDSTAYELPGLPCSLVITTAEGDNYEVTVMSADNSGANLEYKKMLAEPAEVAPVPAPAPSYLKGLVGHWKFDEGKGSIVRDSARNYDGTLKGVKWTTGRLGAALEFDGHPEHGVYLAGSVGDRSLLNLGTLNLTISSWVKMRGEGGTIVARARPRVTLYRLGVTTKKAYIDFISGKQRWVLQTDPILQPDTWYHIVGVFDRSQKRARLYVDGRESATGALTTRSSSGIGESTTIGRWFSGGPGPSFEGVIDEVMIFNRALSAEEIQELYTKVSGFRPVLDVVIADIDESYEAILIDFETGKLVSVPDQLRHGGGEETYRWMARKGLDAGVEFAGDEYGVIAVDVVATRIASEQWDKITPAELRDALAAEPTGVEKDERQTTMPAKGEYPPTFAFRTREGGAGVLQIVDADRSSSKRTIHFRYKMLQETTEPVVQAGTAPVDYPESFTKLQALGRAVVMFTNDNNGKMPATLQELKPYIEQDFQWLVDNVEYLGKGKSAADAPNTTVAYDKTLLEKLNGTNVLFLDAHVGFLTPEELEKLGILGGKEPETTAILE